MATLAARNNAEWCDVMCRSHGGQSRFDAATWSCPTRTPPFYPDAVTLVPDPFVPDLLARIDATAGCSVKDSFGSVDLSEYGFRVLFEAQWIMRTGPAPPTEPAATSLRWERVDDAAGLEEWGRAWAGDERPDGLFRADLLHDRSVAILAGYEGDRLAAGLILNRSDTVVGISNFFSDPAGDPSTSFAGCLAFASSLYPGLTFVGYESGRRLAAAGDHGFKSAGPLRVWVLDG